jgi:hypothetical protein
MTSTSEGVHWTIIGDGRRVRTQHIQQIPSDMGRAMVRELPTPRELRHYMSSGSWKPGHRILQIIPSEVDTWYGTFWKLLEEKIWEIVNELTSGASAKEFARSTYSRPEAGSLRHSAAAAAPAPAALAAVAYHSVRSRTTGAYAPPPLEPLALAGKTTSTAPVSELSEETGSEVPSRCAHPTPTAGGVSCDAGFASRAA